MSLRTVAPQQKYGLIKKRVATAPLKKTGFSNAFTEDSDDDSGGTSNCMDVGRVNSLLTQRSAAAERQANKIYSDALAEDPTAFDYDGVYDSFKVPEVKSHALSQSNTKEDAPKARYISNLLTTASVRGKEKDRIYEKKLLKDRKVEDELFGDKPKFMTTAYKQKLIEDQKWENEDKLTDELEARTDVRSQGMHGFYANLLTKNVAMGGNVEGSAVSAYTAGSQRNAHMGSGPAADRDNSAAQIRSSSDVPDVSSKRKYDSDDGQHESGKATDSTITSSSSSSSRNDSMGTSKAARLEAENIVSEDVLNITSGPDIIVDPVEDVSEAVAVIAPSKAEIISSARQRFLDRKLASSS